MRKRSTWFGAGLVAGAALAKWVEVKGRRRLASHFPAGGLSLPASPPNRAAPNRALEVADMAGRARERAAGKVVDLRGAVHGVRGAPPSKEAGPARPLRLVQPGENPRVG
jgi:hypothetical protein